MTSARLVLLILALLLAGCSAAPRGPYAPGLAQGGGVDGLEVGHRLMDAGEAELALKAYYRAAADRGLTAEILSSIGSADLALGRVGQAEALLRRATQQDERSVSAWNNLGVALVEQGRPGEAAEAFRRAFALDGGRSDSIRDNLRFALAQRELPGYPAPVENRFALVRRGDGDDLLRTPSG